MTDHLTLTPTPTHSTRRLLLVEDNATNTLVLTHKLKKHAGYVDCASNGVEALEQIGSHTYDLVIMDVSMPVMDGFEATRRIRASDADFSQVPILGLTAHNYDEVRDKCLEVGMDGFLCKPVSDSELFCAIEGLLADPKAA